MTDQSHSASRRLFLQQARAFSLVGAGAPLAMGLTAASAMAATGASDYKALVCIFLYGGNDAFNTVLATDDESWANYTSVRNQQPESIALLRNKPADKTQTPGSPAWLGGVLPISPATVQAGRSLALHPMLSDVQGMFNTTKRLAIVANVGPLAEPLKKSDYASGLKQKPRKLFSHNDQQSTWMALAPEGATMGWGGRLADAVVGANSNSLFTAISPGGSSVWLSGKTVQQYQTGEAGPIRLGPAPAPNGIKWVYESDAVGMALERIVTKSRSNHLMASDLADIGRRAISAEQAISAVLPSAATAPYGLANALQYDSLAGGKELNPLARQLQTVARIISAQSKLGLKRQVFFVGLGGFDTHSQQNRSHAELLSRLNHGLRYFDAVLSAMALTNQVTTFTASDFGRSFTTNGDGSDHGWGAHHLVMGGAVQGGDVHGDFPVLAKKNRANSDFDGSPDQLTNGVLLPKISIEQYGASLGRWFGVSDSQLKDVFPNLNRFSGVSGFMKA